MKALRNREVRSGLKSRPDSLRDACMIAAGRANIHGRNPAKRMGMKNHAGWTRRCDVVRKRSKCSCTKKKRANSGLDRETAMNHGMAMMAKIAKARLESGRGCANLAITALPGRLAVWRTNPEVAPFFLVSV